VIKFGMRSPKIRRYAVIIAMALMLVSVVVLADVIYYYQGVITAQVSAPPIVFYNGTFTYNNTNRHLHVYIKQLCTGLRKLHGTTHRVHSNNTTNQRLIRILLPSARPSS